MDRIMLSILELSTESLADLSKLYDVLQSYSSMNFNLHWIDQALAALDCRTHTFGYAWLLSRKLNFKENNEHTFISQARSLFIEGNPTQLKLGLEFVNHITQMFITKLQGAPIRAVLPLKILIQKLAPIVKGITPLHAYYAQICLLANSYEPALEVLDVDITDVSPRETHVSIIHVLDYFYYGGMIYSSVQNWNRALFFFRTAITVPANAISPTMAKSYKKFILVSLLETGSVEALPKYTSNVFTKHCRGNYLQYTEFAELVEKLNEGAATEFMNRHVKKFTADDNIDLVELCVASIKRRKIQQLTKVYLTLSLSDIAQNAAFVTPKEVERLLLTMIQNGEIFAHIDQRNGMVSFEECPTHFDTNDSMDLIHDKISSAMTLNERLREVELQIIRSASYILKQSSAEKTVVLLDQDETDVSRLINQ